MDLKAIKMDILLMGTLILISLIMFFYNIGAPSYFETDEVIYSQVAREIVRTNDWVTMHLFGKPWFIHPPLYMWLIAGSSFVFGDNEFNTRLWSALFAIGLVFVTYLLGKKMFRDNVGLIAGFIVATTLQVILQSRLAIFDIPLVFFIMLSLLSFFYWLEDKKPLYYYLFFMFMGWATFMKGPVGILLPLLVIVPFLITKRDLKALLNFRLILGFIITFIVGGAWYTAESIIHGKAFIDSVFGFYIIGRYLTSIEQHYGPWYFYVPVILFGFIPWVSFLPYSIAYQWRQRGDEANLFSVLWMAIVLLFFSIAGTKLPGYIMSFYPIAAISVAKLLSDYASGEDAGVEVLVWRAVKTLAIYSVILIVIGVMFRMFAPPDGMDKIFGDLNIMLIILGTGGVIASLLFFKTREIKNVLITMVITMIIFSLHTAANTFVDLDDFKPMKAISMKINSDHMTRERIIGYKVLNKGSFQHYLDKPVVWIGDMILLRDTLQSSNKKTYLITNEKDYKALGAEFNRTYFVLFKGGDMILLINRK